MIGNFCSTTWTVNFSIEKLFSECVLQRNEKKNRNCGVSHECQCRFDIQFVFLLIGEHLRSFFFIGVRHLLLIKLFIAWNQQCFVVIIGQLEAFRIKRKCVFQWVFKLYSDPFEMIVSSSISIEFIQKIKSLNTNWPWLWLKKIKNERNSCEYEPNICLYIVAAEYINRKAGAHVNFYTIDQIECVGFFAYGNFCCVPKLL